MTWILGAEGMTEWGWRIPFIIAGPLGAIAIWIRMRLEDSPEFHALHSEDKLSKAPLREALRFPRQLLLVASVITLLGSGFYLLMTFMTTYLKTAVKLDPGSIFWLTVVGGLIAAAVMPLSGHLSDRMGDRRPVMVVGALAFAAAVAWFFLVAPGAAGPLDLAPPLVGLAATVGLFCGVPYATMSELLPAHVRSTGIALGYNIPIAVFGGSAPLVSQWLIARTGDLSSPMWFFLGTAVIALIGLMTMKRHDLLGHDTLAVTGSIDARQIREQARLHHSTRA